jgi:hypothetical protein
MPSLPDTAIVAARIGAAAMLTEPYNKGHAGT